MIAKLTLPPQQIEAHFAADKANAESRTVPVTWYTGATVRQFSWEKGLHNLTLVMDPDKVDLGRLESGAAPFTRGHSDPNDPGCVLGKVVKASLDAKAGTALVRFSKRADVEPVYQDVLDSILTNVSIEAQIHKMKEVTKEGDSIRSFVATKWEPTCIALVAQGADPGARINAAAEVETECEIELAEPRASAPKDKPMAEDTIKNAGEQARSEDAVKLAAAQAERARVLQITKIAEVGKLDAKLSAEHIEKGTSVDDFRKLAFETLAARSEQNATKSHAGITRDEKDTIRLAIPQAILHVNGLSECKADAPGRDYVSLVSRGPLAICEFVTRQNGKNPDRMTRDELIKFALSTSDLPYILGATADSALQAGYGAIESSWPLISARRTVSNFRPQYDLWAGVNATFPKVPENSEYKVATISEGRETYQVYTYGQKFIVSRQMLINDSLSALTDIPRQLGVAAAYSQAKLFWDFVIANGNLSDSAAIFSTTHVNYITPGTAISVDNLGIARKTLAAQTNHQGQVIGLTPKYMVVPSAKEQLARQYLSNAYNPSQSSLINPWAGMAQLIMEPRLDASSATAWYVFADPAIAPVFVAVYLAGNEGIFSQSETTVDVDGFKWLMRYDFGVGAVDFRGAVMNAGA